jgi:hypothetical protein
MSKYELVTAIGLGLVKHLLLRIKTFLDRKHKALSSWTVEITDYILLIFSLVKM